MTGFTFRGIHSSRYGIVCDPDSRVVLPEKRRTYIDIPGRHGVYIQTRGMYAQRTESFTCKFLRRGSTSVADTVRQIAAWLSQDGELTFDSEPDKSYMAYYSGEVPGLQHMRYGEFELSFTYNPPLAFSAEKSENIGRGLELDCGGTAPAPTVIRLTNNTDNTITNVQITLRRRTE